MKRLAAALVITLGAGLAAGASGVDASGYNDGGGAPGGSDPTPRPGETFTVTVECVVPEIVSFAFGGETQRDECEPRSGAVGFRLPDSVSTDGTASATFTAPTAAGTYSGTVTFADGSTQSFSIVVVDVGSGAGDGDGDGDGAAGGAGSDATGGLPITGGGGSSRAAMTVAAVLLLAGVGMFGVAYLRRQAPTA